MGGDSYNSKSGIVQYIGPRLNIDSGGPIDGIDSPAGSKMSYTLKRRIKA